MQFAHRHCLLYLSQLDKLNIIMSKLITILGPTASQKTRLAACVASKIGAEILSGDSRQVYRGMDYGTGKDYEDYIVDGVSIPYHLIDIVEAGERYNVYRFQTDFLKDYDDICARGKMALLCGGTGLYIEAVLGGYKLIHVPPNHELRAELENKSNDELIEMLKSYKTLHNTTDIDTRQRMIRALEIEVYYAENADFAVDFPTFENCIIGVDVERDLRRSRITNRLRARLDAGLIDEVRGLLDKGISSETLIYYGLEYKFVTNYVLGVLSKEEMIEQLNIAIHQFAKRQMTWFRGMERRGYTINWIDGSLDMPERTEAVLNVLRKQNFIE